MIHYTLVHTCKKTTINIIGLDNTKNTIKNSPLRSLHDPTSIAKDQRKKEKRRKKEKKKRNVERKIDSEEEKIKLSIKPWSIWNVNPEMDGGLGSVTRDEKSRWRRNVGTGWERRGNSMPGRLTRGRRNGSSSFPRRYFTRHSFFSVSSRRFIVPLILATGSRWKPASSTFTLLTFYSNQLDECIRVFHEYVALLSTPILIRAKFIH